MGNVGFCSGLWTLLAASDVPARLVAFATSSSTAWRCFSSKSDLSESACLLGPGLTSDPDDPDAELLEADGLPPDAEAPACRTPGFVWPSRLPASLAAKASWLDCELYPSSPDTGRAAQDNPVSCFKLIASPRARKRLREHDA